MGRGEQLGHAHFLACLGGQKSGIERDIPDVATGHIEPCQLGVIDAIEGYICWENGAPDSLALHLVWEWKIDDKAQPPLKRRIERGLVVGRQDREAGVGLHALQQVTDLDVGITVVAVLDFAALAEQGVRLIEQENGAALLGSVEHALEVFFGLADIFINHRGEIDPVKIEMQLVRQHLGGHCLAGAALADEQCAYS